jgi:hypothetical protein
MSRPRKHKFRILEIGESYEVANPPKWLRAAIYNHGAATGKYFSVCQLSNESMEVRRTEGPPTAEDISRGKSLGAKIMHARHKAKREEAKRLQGARPPLLDQYRGAALPWTGGGGRYGYETVNSATGRGIGVYLLWRGPRLIYIGSSHFLIERFAAHRATRKDPKRKPTAVTIITCRTIEEALSLENELIYALEPYENVVGGVY